MNLKKILEKIVNSAASSNFASNSDSTKLSQNAYISSSSHSSCSSRSNDVTSNTTTSAKPVDNIIDHDNRHGNHLSDHDNEIVHLGSSCCCSNHYNNPSFSFCCENNKVKTTIFINIY
jgi:hypothetical protein